MGISPRQFNTQEDILPTLKKIVAEVANLGIDAKSIRDDANVFEDCGIDSTSVTDLIFRIEEQFTITLNDEDLDVDIFRRLSTLAGCVLKKLTGVSELVDKKPVVESNESSRRIG